MLSLLYRLETLVRQYDVCLVLVGCLDHNITKQTDQQRVALCLIALKPGTRVTNNQRSGK